MLCKVGYNCINNWSIDLVVCVIVVDVFSIYDSWIFRKWKWFLKDVEKEFVCLFVYLVVKFFDLIFYSWCFLILKVEFVFVDYISQI